MAKKKQPVVQSETDNEIHHESVAQKIEPSLDSVALSVVRINDVYQLIKIPFNKRTLDVGVPEVVLTDTDRFEIQSQFDYHADLEYLLKEELDE